MRDFLLVSTKPSGRDFVDHRGKRFGRLTVLGILPRREDSPHVYWLCRCDCGAITSPTSGKLTKGYTVSCGCFHHQKSSARIVHGHARKGNRSPEYGIYVKMKSRCLSPKDPGFRWYGARGIRVCDRWLHGEGGVPGFVCFLDDMGRRPSRLHSLDRKDTNGNYEPSNCRWATNKEQARNRRNNRYVLVNGERLALAEACERLALDVQIVTDRMKRGWTFERARAQQIRGRP